MITFTQIIGTQIFMWIFMGTIILGTIWALIYELFFNNTAPKIKPRKGIV